MKYMNKRQKLIRSRQQWLNRKYASLIIVNLVIVFAIMIIALVVGASGKNQNEGDCQTTTYESMDHIAVTSPANTPNTEDEKETTKAFSRNLSEEDKLMLAKIAMAEAEGESLETKMLVIYTVLNRVESNDFPDTIEEVIFQEYKGTYQFSPVIPGGRYWTTTPNAECWEAVEIINCNEYDFSEGALYFESCSDPDNWHSRNLEFLFESEGMRFYK